MKTLEEVNNYIKELPTSDLKKVIKFCEQCLNDTSTIDRDVTAILANNGWTKNPGCYSRHGYYMTHATKGKWHLDWGSNNATKTHSIQLKIKNLNNIYGGYTNIVKANKLPDIEDFIKNIDKKLVEAQAVASMVETDSKQKILVEDTKVILQIDQDRNLEFIPGIGDKFQVHLNVREPNTSAYLGYNPQLRKKASWYTKNGTIIPRAISYFKVGTIVNKQFVEDKLNEPSQEPWVMFHPAQNSSVLFITNFTKCLLVMNEWYHSENKSKLIVLEGISFKVSKAEFDRIRKNLRQGIK